MTVTYSTISGNSVEGSHEPRYGGGILGGNVTVTSSSVSGNSAWGGGGISAANVTVTSSTISGNSATSSGGIFGGTVTVTSSTVSGNSAYSGGGISGRDVTLISSTITGNSSVSGGGVVAFGDSPLITISNSIVTQNHGDEPDLWITSATATVEYSLIGDNSGTNLPEAPVGSPDANGNLVGGPVYGVIDPLLGPLVDNGGPTLTHALLPGSPAINAGHPTAMAGVDGVPLYDQRGEPYTRTADGNGGTRIDIGAYERQSLTVEILAIPSPTITVVDEVTIQFSSTVSGFDPRDLELSLTEARIS